MTGNLGIGLKGLSTVAGGAGTLNTGVGAGKRSIAVKTRF
jgi:X-X-X-Leu-X-X-Gly heptad repeat protein